VVSGVSVILSVVIMVGAAVTAFQRGEDTSLAMKVPGAFAVAFSFLFVRSVRRILDIEKGLPR
jgi:flagellar motor component MotA